MSFSTSTSVGRPSSSVSRAVIETRPFCHSGAVRTSSTTAQTSAIGASISVLALPPNLAIRAPPASAFAVRARAYPPGTCEGAAEQAYHAGGLHHGTHPRSLPRRRGRGDRRCVREHDRPVGAARVHPRVAVRGGAARLLRRGRRRGGDRARAAR